jgi:hypothetical protein
MNSELTISKAKDLLAKEIYEKYLKQRINTIYENLSGLKLNLVFSDSSVVVLSLESCTALVFTSQEKTDFCGEICIEYTILHKVLTTTDIRTACLVTQLVKVSQETEIRGDSSVNVKIYPPSLSQEEFDSFVNYETYLQIEDGGFIYPLSLKDIGLETLNNLVVDRRPNKNISSLTKEILNQFAVVEIF